MSLIDGSASDTPVAAPAAAAAARRLLAFPIAIDPLTLATMVVAAAIDNTTNLDVNITQVLERQEVRPVRRV